MKKLLLSFLFFSFVFTSFAQKEVEAVRTFIDLYPVVVSVKMKTKEGEKDAHFLLTHIDPKGSQVRTYKLLVTMDASIATSLRTRENLQPLVAFESVKYDKKMAKKMWKLVRDKTDLDLKLVKPYEVYLIFNTNIKPTS